MPARSREIVAPAKVIVADPPWAFRDRLGARGAAANYPVMDLLDICRFRLPRREPDSYLFLWRVAAMQRESLDVCGAWGYRPVSELVWRKTLPCGRCDSSGAVVVVARGGKRGNARAPSSAIRCPDCDGTGRKIAFGLGHHVRAAHETCIIAVHGNPKPLVHDIRSTFDAPLGEHSAKPEEFFKIVERFSAGPYVELFARKKRVGWISYGHGVGAEVPR
jgi:N6-adenosine-specific RNA methylase IME4